MNRNLALIVAFIWMWCHQTKAQCEVGSKLFPDGTLYYFTDPVLIYKTKEKELRGNVATDRELYFLALLPKPAPSQKDGRKFKEDLLIEFDNQTQMTLRHFDARYIQDTVLVIMYQIPKDSLAKFTERDISSLTSEVYNGAGMRKYNLVLHRNAIMEQLNCLLRKTDRKEPN